VFKKLKDLVHAGHPATTPLDTPTQPSVTVTSSGALQVDADKLVETKAAQAQIRAADSLKIARDPAPEPKKSS